MITPKLNRLEPSDVDNLHGLTLNIAFAYYILGWRWYKRSEDNYPWILLDSPVPVRKHLHHEAGIHIGSEHYVFKALPKFHENMSLLMQQEEKIREDGMHWEYAKLLELEVRSGNNFDLIHASADKRARAMVKLYIANHAKEKTRVGTQSRPHHQSS